MSAVKSISLTKGAVSLIDNEDFDAISKYSWHLTSSGYAARRESGKIILMHRQLLGIHGKGSNIQGDHINMNRLDNRRSNLRVVNNRENNLNRGIPSNNTSGYLGVSFCKSRGNWEAYITNHGVRKSLGRHSTAEEAAVAYNKAAVDLHGDLARINKIKEGK
ncbi:AP2 domain-containing protein [Paenibacillus sp. PDC88]|uniref:AP2 domain-containing protein n=1 Tax=Paenibacillus sp. PDC88 TaxID=1884375 RepID=UPI00089C69B2|nr:AP2 domain-containing protein [Paenibacillus sp. PDC88]SDW23526.1 AP2 domain-containing protein [Paenibacillus sp. PDC88]